MYNERKSGEVNMEKDRPVVPTYCYFQGCYNPAYEREIERGKDLCFRFNSLHPCDREGQAAIPSTKA